MLSFQENPKLVEEKVQQVYNLLKELCEVEDLPAVCYNARRALGVIWQITSDLDLEFEQLFHYKV
ncbi:MAG: hypothetical protein Q7J85_13815 [Bacillota bacterium]|nr:hypothetical protein [Bacillota bacterium]